MIDTVEAHLKRLHRCGVWRSKATATFRMVPACYCMKDIGYLAEKRDNLRYVEPNLEREIRLITCAINSPAAKLRITTSLSHYSGDSCRWLVYLHSAFSHFHI